MRKLKIWPVLLSALMLAAVGARSSNAQSRGSRKPYSFLVVLADDLGAPELGCYGNTEHATPRLDEMARRGMRFRTCYATPLCSPTRVMLMTGRYGFRTGWLNLMGRPGSPVVADPTYDLGTRETTFADVLKTKGYVTALAGKWQLTGKHPTLIKDCGFDTYRMWAYKQNLPEGVEHKGRWEGEPGNSNTARFWHPSLVENGKYLETTPDTYGPTLCTDFLIDFMRANRSRQFCAYYSSLLTHGPHEETPDPQKPGMRKPRGFKSNVEYMDHEMGRLLDALDRLDLAKSTIVLFVGDNGTAARGKGQVTEQGARVPFIALCPGTIPAGTVSDELTDLSDILPTLAEFAGAKLPTDRPIDGKSLARTLRDPKKPHRDWIYSYLTNRQLLRDRRWLQEGNGRFYDCGDQRDGVQQYRDVTDSQEPEVVAARQRFAGILAPMAPPQPVPEGQPMPRRARRRMGQDPK